MVRTGLYKPFFEPHERIVLHIGTTDSMKTAGTIKIRALYPENDNNSTTRMRRHGVFVSDDAEDDAEDDLD